LFLFGPSSSFALAVEISLVAMVGLDVTAYFVLLPLELLQSYDIDDAMRPRRRRDFAGSSEDGIRR
jgi:hypothetical protein